MEISRPSFRTRSPCDRLSFDLLLLFELFEAVRENPKPACRTVMPLFTMLSDAVRSMMASPNMEGFGRTGERDAAAMGGRMI